MIRFSLILSLLLICSVGFSQKAYSLFVDNVILDVYEKEMVNVIALQKEIPNKQDIELKKSMYKLQSCTEKLSRIGLAIYDIMNNALDVDKLEALHAMPMSDGMTGTNLEFVNARHRKTQPHKREILMSTADLDNFLTNVSAFRDVHESLKFETSAKSAKVGIPDMGPIVANVSKIINNTY